MTPSPHRAEGAQTEFCPMIVDPDSDYVFGLSEQVKATQKAGYPDVLFALTGVEAVQMIEDAKNNVAAIFINPLVALPNLLRIVKVAHQKRPATPIYVLNDGDAPFTGADLARLGVQGFYLRSENFLDLIGRISPEIYKIKPDVLSKEDQAIAEHEGYLPIPIGDFLGGAKIFLDVYVKIPHQSKYLKIANGCDVLSAERVKGFLNKNVSHFYVTKKAHKLYIKHLDRMEAFVRRYDKVSFAVRYGAVLEQGSILVAEFMKGNFNEKHVERSREYLSEVFQIISEYEKNGKKTVRTLLNLIPSYEHAVSVSSIASILAHELKIESQQLVEQVGLAALLHDVGLSALPKHLQSEDESQMSNQELNLYYEHPRKGAKMIEALGGVESMVIQAVLQHHERRDGKGYPNKLSSDRINRVAEIIGISDFYVRTIERNRKSPSSVVRAEMEERAFGGYSLAVVEAFRRAFFISN